MLKQTNKQTNTKRRAHAAVAEVSTAVLSNSVLSYTCSFGSNIKCVQLFLSIFSDKGTLYIVTLSLTQCRLMICVCFEILDYTKSINEHPFTEVVVLLHK